MVRRAKKNITLNLKKAVALNYIKSHVCHEMNRDREEMLLCLAKATKEELTFNTMNTLASYSLKRQPNLFGEFEATAKIEEVKEQVGKLLKVDNTDLLILSCISETPGIQAKAIAENIHLSRYQTLERSKNLVDLQLLRFSKISSEKTGIKPAFSFFLEEGITQKDILQEINRRKNLQNDDLVNNIDSQDQDLKGLSIAAIKLRILELNQTAQITLSIICNHSKITAKQIAEVVGIKAHSLNRYLIRLRKMGFINYDEPIMSGGIGKEHSYYLVDSLDKDMMKSILNSISSVHDSELKAKKHFYTDAIKDLDLQNYPQLI